MSGDMQIWEAVLLGAIEGFTEFLPVSSTGHLTITEKLLGYDIDDDDITAFTAIIQSGAVLATVLFLREDILRMLGALLKGAREPGKRDTRDFRFAIAVALGSIPIAVIGLTFKDQIETTLRSLWFVGSALILWSGVMFAAERAATQERGEEDVTRRDTLLIGLTQCMALIPGVSRSGATISAGLFLGLDRITVTRLSFFLSIPALGAATVLQTITKFDDISDGVGWGPTLTATAVSFVVAFGAVSWLLRFIANHGYTGFIIYRVILGTFVLSLVVSGAVEAT